MSNPPTLGLLGAIHRALILAFHFIFANVVIVRNTWNMLFCDIYTRCPVPGARCPFFERMKAIVSLGVLQACSSIMHLACQHFEDG
jgi:hypothetical protein